MLTSDKFEGFKADYNVYRKTTVTDRYGNVKESVVAGTPKSTIHVMWHPVTDEASVAEYGERVQRMLEAVLYGDADISEFDIISIGSDNYEVRSVLHRNTHRMIRVERISFAASG